MSGNVPLPGYRNIPARLPHNQRRIHQSIFGYRNILLFNHSNQFFGGKHSNLLPVLPNSRQRAVLGNCNIVKADKALIARDFNPSAAQSRDQSQRNFIINAEYGRQFRVGRYCARDFLSCLIAIGAGGKNQLRAFRKCMLF